MFYESYQLKSSAFRRDMKRALCMIESATLGPTKLELAFPTEITGDTTYNYMQRFVSCKTRCAKKDSDCDCMCTGK